MSKKIAHIAPLFTPHKGGVETHVAQLAHVFSAKGYDQVVITAQHDASLPLQERIDGVMVHRIPTRSLETKLGVWLWMMNNADVLKKQDIVHVHDVFWWIMPLYPSLRAQVHTTFHGWETQFPIPWRNKLHRLIVAWLSRATIHVGGWIQDFYWDTPTAVIYGGTQVRRATTEKKLPSSATKKLHIVFIGRLSADNQIKQYSAALKTLTQRGIDVDVTWVGDGDLADVARSHGVVTGMVDNPSDYVAQADIVFSSSYLSMLEALSCDKIVCSVYDTALKKAYIEYFPGEKYLLHAGDGQQLAEKIMLQLQEGLQKKSRAAGVWARQQTWQKVADTYEKIWQA